MPATPQTGIVCGQIQQWNAGAELAVTSDFVVDVTYLGNKGSDLQTGDLERNQPDPAALGALLRSGKEWNWVSDSASAAAAGVPYPYAGFANYAFFALMPYPQAAQDYGPLFFVGSPLGSSDYHAFQLTATKRMSSGVAANASYTLSRSRGNRVRRVGAAVRQGAPIHERSWYARKCARQRLVDQHDLPLSLRHTARIVSNNAHTGWSTFGYPIYVNVNPNADLRSQFNSDTFNQANPGAAGNRYFDPAAFTNPSYGELGTGPGLFDELRGFGGAFEDLGVMKEFRADDRSAFRSVLS